MSAGDSKGNGNGNGKIDDFDADDLTPTVVPIANVQNREMLGILGNYLLEARQHVINLETLYTNLRQLSYPAPQAWAMKALDEFERHQTENEDNLGKLREFVLSGRAGL
jgi:hypothetical protein